MKVVFASNYFNHHQAFLSEALHRQTEGEYHFIATGEMRQERKALGYGTEEPGYVRKAHLDELQRAECETLIREADLLLSGSAPEELVAPRIRGGKLVFRYAERPLKKGMSRIKYVPRLLRWHKSNPRSKPIYMLCASAYTAADYDKFFLFRNRTYRWGYFPAVKQYESADALMAKKNPCSILWAGRMIDWKHPELCIQTAKRLKESGCSFEMNLIGTGDMEEDLRRMVQAEGLEECVHLLGARKPEQVREAMEKAGIYLFTSDFQEGWGAVLNESMNSGCAVVASHAIGSVPFLIKNEYSGLIFRSGDIDMLYEKVRFLLENPDKQADLGRKAYETMLSTWNPEVAAERLLNLAKHILAGEESPDLYKDGPCSKAPILENDWM